MTAMAQEKTSVEIAVGRESLSAQPVAVEDGLLVRIVVVRGSFWLVGPKRDHVRLVMVAVLWNVRRVPAMEVMGALRVKVARLNVERV